MYNIECFESAIGFCVKEKMQLIGICIEYFISTEGYYWYFFLEPCIYIKLNYEKDIELYVRSNDFSTILYSVKIIHSLFTHHT
jgi:hypothetical protein